MTDGRDLENRYSMDLDGRSLPAKRLTVRNLVKRTETENGGQNGGVTEKKQKFRKWIEYYNQF